MLPMPGRILGPLSWSPPESSTGVGVLALGPALEPIRRAGELVGRNRSGGRAPQRDAQGDDLSLDRAQPEREHGECHTGEIALYLGSGPGWGRGTLPGLLFPPAPRPGARPPPGRAPGCCPFLSPHSPKRERTARQLTHPQGLDVIVEELEL